MAYYADSWVNPILEVMEAHQRAIFIMVLMAFFISIYIMVNMLCFVGFYGWRTTQISGCILY